MKNIDKVLTAKVLTVHGFQHPLDRMPQQALIEEAAQKTQITQGKNSTYSQVQT